MPDREKLEQWFREYSRDIHHFLIYYTGSPDVDDLVQDVFIKAYRAMDQYQGQAGVKTWLMKIARHQAIDAQRRKRRQAQVFMRFFSENPEKQPDEILEEQETLSAFYQATRQLKQSYRDVLMLRLLEQFSVEETAEILNWKKAKVTLTYHRALKKLQETFPLPDEEGGYANGR